MTININTQLKDIYIFEKGLIETLESQSRSKQRYQKLAWLFFTTTILSILWSVSKSRQYSSSSSFTSSSPFSSLSFIEAFTINILNESQQPLENTEATVTNQQQQQSSSPMPSTTSSIISSNNSGITETFKFYIVILFPILLSILLLIWSLIMYYSLDDPSMFIQRCNQTLSIFNIYFCTTNKKIMLVPRANLQHHQPQPHTPLRQRQYNQQQQHQIRQNNTLNNIVNHNFTPSSYGGNGYQQQQQQQIYFRTNSNGSRVEHNGNNNHNNNINNNNNNNVGHYYSRTNN